jgi:FkbM family methyltransferase
MAVAPSPHRRDAYSKIPSISLLDRIKGLGHRAGIDIARHRPASARRIARLRAHGIATVIDVGANKGQYARELRTAGYQGAIMSFEPLETVYPVLQAAAADDASWQTFRVALSDSTGHAELHVAANTASSSLRPMLPLHEQIEPKAAIVGRTVVPLARLDDLLASNPLVPPALLKIDVQGHELDVLRGSPDALRAIALLELEVSIRPLYEGQPLLHDVLDATRSLGFRLVALEPGFYDRADGTILQFDAFFVPCEGYITAAEPRPMESSTDP